jgi:hypothetical protein
VGKREHDVGIAGGQKFAAARVQPAVAGVGLTLRTVPVATRVEGDRTIPAARTLIDVATERGGPATHDRGEDLQMQPREPLSAVIEE